MTNVTKSLLTGDFGQQGLMLWWMHRLAEEFENGAILKGGMELALMDSPRRTNDLDYVFVPFRSKNQIEPILRKIAEEIPNADIQMSKNSKALRLEVFAGETSVQIEASVAIECKSQVMLTSSLARSLQVNPRPIRVMAVDVAFSHKLAAWNERRLHRDLFDCYFLYQVQNQLPNMQVLQARLHKIESRIPKYKKIKSMDLEKFARVLQENAQLLTDKKLRDELQGVFDDSEFIGLSNRMKTAIHRLAQQIQLG